MKYNPINDQLEPTDELVNGESDILKSIANNVPEFAGNWEAMWENITLRAKIKEAIVNYSEKEKNPELLEAPFVIKCNDQFHLISEKTKQKKGRLDSKDIFFEFDEWIKKEIRKIKLNSGEK